MKFKVFFAVHAAVEADSSGHAVWEANVLRNRLLAATANLGQVLYVGLDSVREIGSEEE